MKPDLILDALKAFSDYFVFALGPESPAAKLAAEAIEVREKELTEKETT